MTDNAPDNARNGVCENTPAGTAVPGSKAPSVDESDGVPLHIAGSLNDTDAFLVAAGESPVGCMSDGTPSGAPFVPPLLEVVGEDSPPGPQTGIPRYGNLIEVAAVRLEGLGPALFFTAEGLSCVPGDKVVVEMEEGQVLGEVASVMRMDPGHLENGSGFEGKIRPVARKATDKDLQTAESNAEVANEALEYCRRCVIERNLDMKLVDVLILHDRGKMVFYFTAPARIDFRELVKDLVRRYRTRIELRQIGVRHETQMVGALGNCGMVCCCRRYLRKFAPVAIKMAKEQNVFLNPIKISGICGRLLCCLAYEQQHYDEFYRSCPKLGKKYQTDAGPMRVLRASLFRESVTVLSETGEEIEYGLADWNALNPSRPNAQQHPPRKEPPGEGKQRRNGKKSENRPADRLRENGEFPDIPACGVETDLSPEEGFPPAAMENSWPITDGPLPLEMVAADSEPDDNDNDTDGSIFGLSARREPPSSREAAGSGSERGRRRRPPRRRGPGTE